MCPERFWDVLVKSSRIDEKENDYMKAVEQYFNIKKNKKKSAPSHSVHPVSSFSNDHSTLYI